MDGDPSQTLAWGLPALLFALLLALSGLFSGSEVAIFTLARSGRLRRRHEGRRYRRLRRLLQSSDRTLATIQLSTMVLHVGGALSAAHAARALWPSGGWAAVWAGLIVAAVGLLVFAEAVPRAVAVRWPEAFAGRVAPFLEFAIFLLSPIRRPLVWVAGRLARSTLSSQQISQRIQGEEEFKALLGTTEVSGLLDEDEREMIDSVFEFAETTADEIMTPRTDIEGYPVTLSQDEMLDALDQTPHSRVVIYEDTIDQIVGLLHAKDVLLNPEPPWRDHLHKPLFVPAAMELEDLLTQFKRSHLRLAVVLDEFGGTAGIVTMHDLIEEIVGELPEEEEETEIEIDRIEPGVYLVAGRLEVSECNEALGTTFPEESARTVAGLVFTHLGRVPRVGEEIHLGPAWIRVIELEENRIERLEIRVGDAGGSGEAASAEDESKPANSRREEAAL